jgi:peptidoglycan/xylan/chitin deacetylase (PgdA/CDA1 family)
MIPMKPLLSLLSPAGPRAQLSVFIFHRVLPQTDAIFPCEITALQFDKMMEWLKTWFNVLPLDEAARSMKASTLPARAAAITFDDGYADNFSVALPILQRHGLTSTFFVATGFLDGGRMWNDTVIESVRACTMATLDLTDLGLGHHSIVNSEQKGTAIGSIIQKIKYLPDARRVDLAHRLTLLAQVRPPDDLMMTSGQVRDLRRAGMQIGAHTVTHPILAVLEPQIARQEIANSKVFLKELLGEDIRLFAYPNGKPGTDYLPDVHPAMLRDLGFDAAVSTSVGTGNCKTDPLQIPRFTPWVHGRLGFGARVLDNVWKT